MDDDFRNEDIEERKEKIAEEKKNTKPDKPVAVKQYNKPKVLEKVRGNPWMLSTFVLGALALVLILTNFSLGGVTGNVSKDIASANLMKFLSQNVQGEVTLLDVSKENGLYKVNIDYQGQEIPLYVTLDGNYMFSTPQPLASTDSSGGSASTTEIPKTDKPSVELFVMSFCPYGTQAEKGILPVVALLGDKIDFKLRFVHYTLHGEKEDLENFREICIREEQGQDKLNKYLSCILNSDDPNVPGDVSACEKTAGIDSAKLQNCLKNNVEDYYGVDSGLSQNYGVQGSPTLVINGVESSAGRSPSSYLAGVCAAFNNAPSECNEQLSTSNPSAGFGYNEGTDTVAQC